MINLITDCDLIKVQMSLLPRKLYNQTHQSTLYSKYFYEWLSMNKEKTLIEGESRTVLGVSDIYIDTTNEGL